MQIAILLHLPKTGFDIDAIVAIYFYTEYPETFLYSKSSYIEKSGPPWLKLLLTRRHLATAA